MKIVSDQKVDQKTQTEIVNESGGNLSKTFERSIEPLFQSAHAQVDDLKERVNKATLRSAEGCVNKAAEVSHQSLDKTEASSVSSANWLFSWFTK